LTTRVVRIYRSAIGYEIRNRNIRETSGKIQLLGSMPKCTIIKNVFDLRVGPKNPLPLKAGGHRLGSASDKSYNRKTMLHPCIASLKTGV
jgi:hypothetical protein